MFQKACFAAAALLIGTAIATLNVRGAEDKPSSELPQYRAKQILGSKVNIEGNTAVGTVDDIVLDENGNVDYLIVVTDEKKLVTVPWDAARFNADKRSTAVRITP